jgi:hypothetical protein
LGKLKIGIIDQESLYGDALGAYLSIESDDFDVCVLDHENPDHFMLESSQILLISEQLIDRIGQIQAKGRWIIALTEDPPMEDLKNRNKIPDKIFRYQPAHLVAREIRFVYALHSGKGQLTRRDKTTTILGMISGASRSGKTVIALALSRELSKENHKRVLYLSMDNFSSAYAFFKEAKGGGRSISDFLYFIFKDPGKKSRIPPEGFMFRDTYGVYVFYPNPGRNALKELDKEELSFFMQYIHDYGDFDYIMMDFNNDLSIENQFLLSQCKDVFMIYAMDAVSQIASRHFSDYYSFLSETNNITAYKTICNFAARLKDTESDHFQIESDPESFYESEGVLEISLIKEFGLSITRIKDYILSSQL